MKILTVPHKMLYREAMPVEVIDAKIQGIVDRMFITMYKHKGIGLAANQVNIPLQIVVLNVNHKPMVLINPYICHDGFGVWEAESCLSIPGYITSVERSSEIFVMSYDRQGKEWNFEVNGLLARCIQHEIEHLQGILITDL